MKKGSALNLLIGVFLLLTLEARGQETESDPAYYRAKHGFGGGLTEMVDLSKMDGFDKVLTFDDVAGFASKVPNAIGFTVHPEFETRHRYAHAVVWYTHLSSTHESWPLYLFDKSSANKQPGEDPEASAKASANAKISNYLELARDLINKGGPDGVTIPDKHPDGEFIAYAVLQLNGRFRHTGTFTESPCTACRVVVPGGTQKKCGLGVAHEKHWDCCGSTDRTNEYCRYWELLKEKDRQGK